MQWLEGVWMETGPEGGFGRTSILHQVARNQWASGTLILIGTVLHPQVRGYRPVPMHRRFAIEPGLGPILLHWYIQCRTDANLHSAYPNTLTRKRGSQWMSAAPL